MHNYTYGFSTYDLEIGCPVAGQRLDTGDGFCGNSRKYADYERSPGRWYVDCSDQFTYHWVNIRCCSMPAPTYLIKSTKFVGSYLDTTVVIPPKYQNLY